MLPKKMRCGSATKLGRATQRDEASERGDVMGEFQRKFFLIIKMASTFYEYTPKARHYNFLSNSCNNSLRQALSTLIF